MANNRNMLKQMAAPCILFLAIIGIMFTQPRIASESSVMDSMMMMKKEPIHAKLLQPFLFGHEAFYADLFWIHSLRWSLEKGYQNMYEYLYQVANLITDLDPRFEQVYVWAGLTLTDATSSQTTYIDKIKAINKILLKGWQYIQQDTEGWNHFEKYWMIPQLLGYNYGIELHEHEKALEYTRALIGIPGVPSLMKTWAATLIKDDKNGEGQRYMENLLAIETLKAQMDMTDDDIVKNELKGKILLFYKKLYSEKDSEERMSRIQQQVRDLFQTWRANYSFLPFNLYTLLHSTSTIEEKQNDQLFLHAFFPHLGGA